MDCVHVWCPRGQKRVSDLVEQLLDTVSHPIDARKQSKVLCKNSMFPEPLSQLPSPTCCFFNIRKKFSTNNHLRQLE